MRNRLVLIAAILPWAAAAEAQTLWQNIEAGMSVERLRSIYPEASGQVKWNRNSTTLKHALKIGDCSPDVVVVHSKGTVERIETGMSGGGFESTCQDEAYQLMLSKYG